MYGYIIIVKKYINRDYGDGNNSKRNIDKFVQSSTVLNNL